MKTLEQLWLESGEKPGLKVISESNFLAVLLARTPSGELLGYALNDGVDIATYWCRDEVKLPIWNLFKAPKPRLLAWICREIVSDGGAGYAWRKGDVVLRDESVNMEIGYWGRAYWLDQPAPEERK